MEPFTLPLAAWLAGALGLTAAGALLARRRAKASAAPAALAAGAAAEGPFDGQIRRVELRMEAMEGLQAEFLARVERLGDDDAAERRLQAMAARILGLVRDKDASLDVALAGLDQLRARLRVLEQMGDLAEARGLFERQAERLEAAETRLKGLEATTPPLAELAERMTRLHGQREAIAETAFARLGPLEAKLRELEAALAARGESQPGLDRLETRLAELEAGIRAPRPGLEPLEAALARLAPLEAALERLAPLEARLGAVEAGAGAPLAGLERLAERLEAARAGQEARLEALGAGLAGRIAALEAGSPAVDLAADLAERLAALQAQREAGIEATLGRLAPLEAALGRLGPLEARLERLAPLEARLGAVEAGAGAPLAGLERLEARLEAARAGQEARLEALGAGLTGRVAALEGARPAAEIAAEMAADLAGRLAAVAERLGRLEAAGTDAEAEAARLEAQAIAAQMVAARTVAEETRVFASRLALLEASLPRLSTAQALMMQALERQAAPQAAWPLVVEPETPAAGEEPPWPPRVVPLPKG